MIVYHGSYTEIDEIDLSLCEIGKDFGQGFYVTNIRSQAELWAKRKGKKNHNSGFITEFEFDEDICRIMKLKVLRFDSYSEEWLDFVVLNRINKKEQQAHDYDIVEGSVADDDITTRIYDYLRSDVSKKQFLLELTHKTPSHQICFCTVQSLQALTYLKDKRDLAIIHIDYDIIQTLITDYGLSEMEAADIYYTSATYTKLADETTGLYKKDLIGIFELLKAELQDKK